MHAIKSTISRYFPAFAFFAGFIWDAITIGKGVSATDLVMLSGYLFATVPMIWWLVKRTKQQAAQQHIDTQNLQLAEVENWKTRLPYLLLQFLFGSLFSALFILYFKSASHLTAIIWSVGLGALLVANEFLENAYKRFTLTWTLFGFCAILLLNFALPYAVGSVHALWFYVSVIIAVLFTWALKLKISSQLGSIWPTYLVAAVLSSAYVLDVIPPVPLVKRDIQVGTQLQKVAGQYVLQQDKAPWWIFWRDTLNTVHISAGESVYCLSAIYAPSGLDTRLYHRWQHYNAKTGWQTMSRIGFNVAGGRNNGFRGYTVKRNLAFGEWRVIVETENARTITVYPFEIQQKNGDQKKLPVAI